MIEERVLGTASGTMLYDAAAVERPAADWFDRAYWEARDGILAEAPGRGSVLIVDNGAEQWALRHYRRGGLAARLIEDHYLWLGLERTRAFREWRLLAELHGAGLPVPRPVAARVLRRGLSYCSDIITAYLPATRSLASFINDAEPLGDRWLEIGRMLGRIHAEGVCHPDLTAHNILLDDEGRVFLVDFDNCTRRRPGRWRGAGVRRLQRSLRKVALETGTAFDERAWEQLLAGYRAR